MPLQIAPDEALACCAAAKFAQCLAAGGPYATVDDAIAAARHIWWNEASGLACGAPAATL